MNPLPEKSVGGVFENFDPKKGGIFENFEWKRGGLQKFQNKFPGMKNKYALYAYTLLNITRATKKYDGLATGQTGRKGGPWNFRPPKILREKGGSLKIFEPPTLFWGGVHLNCKHSLTNVVAETYAKHFLYIYFYV